jgi:nicotinate-nucleotide pyrophosphorylase (carboxylating)
MVDLHSLIPQWKIAAKIKEYLDEDIPFWDISSSALPNRVGEAKILAKDTGIIAGIPIALEIFRFLNCKLTPLIAEGSEILSPPKAIARIDGEIRNILAGERLALNFIGRMSGIATTTHAAQKILNECAKKNKMKPPIIAATRKTTPGLRLFEKYAVLVGGGDPHRFALSDSIMLKDNHLCEFQSIRDAIVRTKKVCSFSHKIEVEVETFEQALEAAESGVDIILLDNFSTEELRKIVPKIKEKNPKVILEASGGINLANLAAFIDTGVDIISSGSLTHSVKNFDVSLQVIVSKNNTQ